MMIFNPTYACFETSLFAHCNVQAGFGTKNTPALNKIVEAEKIFSMNQVHGTSIKLISSLNSFGSDMESTIPEVDGIITSLDHVVLVARSADCVPVLYVDPVSGLIGASHQGWKGSYMNMAGHMIEKFVDLGSEIENIRVAIGPAVGACCYKIHGPRLEILEEFQPKHVHDVIQEDSEGKSVNLLKLNYLQFLDEGISKENITYSLRCTRCNKILHSYRRDNDKATQNSFIMKV